jgi:hypothetical protein
MIINYFLMGVVFAFYVEYWNDTKGDKTQFDNWHRVIIVALWPVLVIIGISSFFKNK